MSNETADALPEFEMPEPCCGICRWAVKARNGAHYECHRYPPQVSSFMVERPAPGPIMGAQARPQVGFQDRSIFPMVQAHMLCGEYQPDLGGTK